MTGSSSGARLEYVDRLRGLAVLIMVDAHVFDAWTLVADRRTPLYRWAIVIGGYAAPLFLFLVGVGIAFAAGRRSRRDPHGADTTPRRVCRRGVFVLGLAFAFRLQAWLVSGGSFARQLLKVDILNVMGVSMMLAAAVWRVAGSSARRRAVWLLGLSTALVWLMPFVYGWPALDGLADPIEGYLRPTFGRTSFSLVPWTAFVFLGMVAGWAVDRHAALGRTTALTWCGGIGVVLLLVSTLLALGIDFGPDRATWAYSRTFFLMRVGVVLTALPVARAWTARWPGWSPLREFGEASLFVYWIHVELAYGAPTVVLHRALPVAVTVVAYGGVVLLMFGLIRVRDRVLGGRTASPASPGPAPLNA